jgi:hypothetical protein
MDYGRESPRTNGDYYEYPSNLDRPFNYDKQTNNSRTTEDPGYSRAITTADGTLMGVSRHPPGDLHFIPEPTKERREAVKKLALSYRAALDNPPQRSAPVVRVGMLSDTSQLPNPPKELMRRMAREALEAGFRQPYSLKVSRGTR